MGRAAAAAPGGMAAILGMGDRDVETVCREASAATGAVVAPANFNAPGQVVISGACAALERAVALAREQGGKAVPLNVAGPWHSPLMEPAARALAAEIAAAAFRAPAVPVIANVSAEPVVDPGGIRRTLVDQVAGAVRWARSQRGERAPREGLTVNGARVYGRSPDGDRGVGSPRRRMRHDRGARGTRGPLGAGHRVCSQCIARERICPPGCGFPERRPRIADHPQRPCASCPE